MVLILTGPRQSGSKEKRAAVGSINLRIYWNRRRHPQTKAYSVHWDRMRHLQTKVYSVHWDGMRHLQTKVYSIRGTLEQKASSSN